MSKKSKKEVYSQIVDYYRIICYYCQVMHEVSAATTIEALPSEFMPSLLAEPEDFGFHVTYGNCSLQEAQVICLGDPNHMDPDHSSYGELIKTLAQPGDIILVEAIDTSISQHLYNLPDTVNIQSWEDPEFYYRTELILDRIHNIFPLIEKAKIMSEIARLEQALAEQQALLDTIVSTPIEPKTHSETRQSRLEQATEILFHQVKQVIEQRNDALIDAIRTHAPKRIFVIAGSGHWESQKVNEELTHFAHIVLHPNTTSPLTPEDIQTLIQPLSPEERAENKRQWLLART